MDVDIQFSGVMMDQVNQTQWYCDGLTPLVHGIAMIEQHDADPSPSRASAPAGAQRQADRPPLVYACAGCSDAGKLAYDLGLALTRRGDAEMSCLAGVAALRPGFLRQLRRRDAWVIDGCPIECGRGVFEQAGQRMTRHIRLHELGYCKNKIDVDEAKLHALAQRVAGGFDKRR